MRPAARAGAVAVAVALSACGYTTGVAFGDPAIRTVAVEVVGNRTFRQRLEIPLTRRIHEALPVHTGYVPVARGSADAVLEVEIGEVRDRTLVVGAAAPVLEGAQVFAVRARLIDARTGATLRETTVLDRAEFRRPLGENSQTALAEATSDLARKIVLSLEPEL